MVKNDTLPDPPVVFDWLQALCLPKSWEQLERLAQPNGLSTRALAGVLVDENPTLFPGAWRHRPRQIRLRPDPYRLTLAHLGYCIGVVHEVRLAHPGEIQNVEGDALLARAQLYASALAEAAWLGIWRGIFVGLCAVLVRPFGTEPGSGELVEIGLGSPW